MSDTVVPLPGPRETTIEAARFERGEYAIRHIRPSDYEWIFEELWLSPHNLMHYRLGGIPTSPEALLELLWRGVAGQFLIVASDRRSASPYGMVTFYERNDHSATCGMALALSDSARGSGGPLIGAGLAIDHWFRVTPARKLWAEVAGWNAPYLKGVRAFGFEAEGCRREHDWLDGRFWDRHLYALFREHWMKVSPLLRSGAAGRAAGFDGSR